MSSKRVLVLGFLAAVLVLKLLIPQFESQKHTLPRLQLTGKRKSYNIRPSSSWSTRNRTRVWREFLLSTGMQQIYSNKTATETRMSTPKISDQIAEVYNNSRAGKMFPWSNIIRPVNPHSYMLIMNCSDICKNNEHPVDVFLLVMMVSSPNNFEQRQSQRESCLNVSRVSGKIIKTLFLLGGVDQLDTVSRIREEYERYTDIIMEDFHDSYYNLTLKTMMAMKWASIYCPQAAYVMKTDDDVFIHIENIVNTLESSPRKRFMTGYLLQNGRPFRNKGSKWYLGKDEYASESFPPFCSGTGYILSGDLPPSIFTESLTTPFIHLEDVFVGICIAKLGVSVTRGVGFNHGRQNFNYCKFKTGHTVHLRAPRELNQYWDTLQRNPQNVTCDQKHK